MVLIGLRKESLIKGLDRGVSRICNILKDGVVFSGREMLLF